MSRSSPQNIVPYLLTPTPNARAAANDNADADQANLPRSSS